MTKSLDDVLSAFTPEQRARVEARAQELIEEELTLRDLRQAQHLTQERMAELLGVEQENVSRIERRADLLLSTLASYVAAMGGKLRLVAEFPNRKPVAVALGDLSESTLVKPHACAAFAGEPQRQVCELAKARTASYAILRLERAAQRRLSITRWLQFEKTGIFLVICWVYTTATVELGFPPGGAKRAIEDESFPFEALSDITELESWR